MPIPIPHQPHPDVAIVKAVLKDIPVGDVLPYADVARALSMSTSDPAFERRHSRARRQLEVEGIMVTCVPGVGFLRETAEQTRQRVSGRELRTIQRKANRTVRQLETIDIQAVPAEQRPEVYALMTQAKVAGVAAGKRANKKLAAAASDASSEIAMQKALEVLQEREQKSE